MINKNKNEKSRNKRRSRYLISHGSFTQLCLMNLFIKTIFYSIK